MREDDAENTVDVTALIDRTNLGGFQLRIVLLCGMVALLDGADTTSIAIAASAMARKLGVPVSDFGVIFSAGTLGAALGAMAFGPMADRFGRKRLLLVAAAVFGVFTLLTANAGTYTSLAAYRLVAGFGLGGAVPCFLALVSEYVPSRMRGTAVTVLFSAFPLGIMVGGFLNSYLVATFGWESIFYVGGILPLIVAAAMTVALPESLQILILRRDAAAKAAAILARLVPGAVGPKTRLAVASQKSPGVPVKQLFAEGRALDTVLLWVPFFMAFGVLAVAVFFTPPLLREAGGPAAASAGALVNAFHGLGALVGMTIAGRLVERFGPSLTLGTALLAGAAATVRLGFGVAAVPLAAAATTLVGLFAGIAGSGSIAVAALIYPTAIRATGIGWGIGMGRAGQVAAPLFASWLLAHGDGRQMLMVMAAMLVASVAFVLPLGRSASLARAARTVAPTSPRHSSSTPASS